MELYEKVKLDDKLLESLDQILNLDSTAYWTRKDSESSPPFPLSPDSPGSPFDSAPSSPDSYGDAFLNLSAEGSDSPLSNEVTNVAVPSPSPQDGKRKRGRRPLRPFDPIKKKTEEKDKYWLRGFRAYMKTQYSHLRTQMSIEDRTFWRDYLSTSGKPEKGNPYLSYGKKYKNFLFSHQSFATLFKKWFVEHAEEELAKKCEPNSDLWFVFYDYGSKELLNYAPTAASVSPEQRSAAAPVNSSVDAYDITMVDADGFVDSLLCEGGPSPQQLQ